jgi:ribosomal protein L37E
MESDLAADHPVTLGAKQVRLEVLKVNADLEQKLGKLVLNCQRCGMEVHWVQASACPTLGTGGTGSRRRLENRSCSDEPLRVIDDPCDALVTSSWVGSPSGRESD